MNPLIRRIARKLAGLPPYGTPEPSVGDIADLSDRINAMDKGLQDLIHANRTETARALLRMRAELDVVIAQLEGSTPADPEPTGSSTVPSNAS